jgi:NADP-dependent 3-hydroxy acid dehydrogenase YdfG
VEVEGAVEVCIDAILGWAGRVDVLCNNAGVLDIYNAA